MADQTTQPPADAAPLSAEDLEKKKKKAEKAAAKDAKKAKAEAKKQQQQQKQATPNGNTDAAPAEAKKKEIRLKKEFVNTTPAGEKKDLSGPMADAYDPPSVEAAWYSWWEKSRFFAPEQNSDAKEQFIIVIPPPNVTGSLHLGHALTNSIQDALCRYHRMSGRRVLWVPGTDHAGIATQAVVEKKVWNDEKKTKHDFTRDDFVQKIWEWKNKFGNRITSQLRRIGSSVDWDREVFTMDEKLSKAVTTAFVRMYESGIIYRSTRLVNWSCKLRTAISDIEVDYIEVPKMMKMKVPQHDKAYDFGFLFEFAYKVDGSDEELVVATTRPETMLGDTAVAVHPEDPRYKHLHGKFLKHPFVDRKIPIICDPILVDMNFGTGAVKITPAHDPNDYECGKRNKLEFINILNLDGTINANGGKYVGMKRYDCRTAIMEEFKQLGLYRGIKENPMRLATCSRSGDIIEPLLLPQWYVKCDQIGKEAADAVRNGEIEIIPETHKAVWFNWLDNIHDWCISRQLWWGHRVPAWLVNIDGKPSDSASPDNWVVANTEEEARAAAVKKFGTSNITLERDPDVLDTWFSSGLFPFSVMGWPNEESPDFQKYYPTSLLETGSDIIFFWVARMVMMGKFLTGKWPFKQVFLHSMVRDAHGRKMSKSLGNVIDPVDVIEGITLEGLNQTLLGGNLDPREVEKAMKGQKADFPSGISECGTDALRFALCAYTSQGRDINLDINRVVAYRNFCNKIWNATKLSFMVIGDNFSPSATNAPLGTESAIDKWILSRLAAAIEDSNKGFTEFDFARATTAIYNFWLYDLCDVYLEAIKPVMREASYTEENRNAVKQTLFSCLEEGLRLIHPFMPFLSEELWQRLPRRASQKAASICIAAYPTAVEGRTNARIEQEFTSAMELISAIRSLRMEYSVVKKVTPPLIINAKDDAFAALYTSWSSIINTLSYSATTQVARDIAEPPAGSALAIPNQYCELYVILKGLVNAEQEITKLKQKMTNAEKQLQVLVKKVTAADYTTKVPEAVREEDTKKRAASEADIAAMRKAIENFEKLSQS